MSHSDPSALGASRPWVIRPYKAGDEVQLLTLFERTFGKGRSLADWRWKFTERQAPFPHIWVAEIPENGRLVGHYAGIPVRVKIGDRVVNALVSVETMTDPDFRRQGMLTRFGEVVYGAWAEWGQSLVIGFPNQQWGSRKSALGWVPLLPLAWLRYPLRPEEIVRKRRLPGAVNAAIIPPLRLAARAWRTRTRRTARRAGQESTLVVRPHSGEAGIFDIIWQHVSPTWPNLLVRDEGWVAWRFLESVPEPYAVHIAWRNDRPVGYIAFRVAALPEGKRGYIADIFASKDDLGAAAALVVSALDAFARSGATLGLALAAPESGEYSLLRSLGFLRISAEEWFSFELVPLEAALPELALDAVDRWHVSGGDSDII